MGSDTAAARDEGPRAETTSSAHPGPQDGGVGPGGGTFGVPSLSRIKTTHHFATRWHELHPEIPLIPVRRVEPVPAKAGGPRSRRFAWAPVEGWRDGTNDGRGLARLLKADPTLGIALGLGRRGPGLTWFVEILARDARRAYPALKRLLDRDERRYAANWRDEEGFHYVLVGDDRLGGFGPVVVGEYRENGGNPHYPGLEIRLGSDDPATSFVVLPPTLLGNGKPRRGKEYRNAFPRVSDRFLADLGRFAGSPGGVAAASPPTSSDPAGGSTQEGRAPGPKPVGKAIALRGPAGLPSVVATFAGPAAEGPPGIAPPPDLAALVALIKDEVRAGDTLMGRALGHYRRAGEMLAAAKARIAHGDYLKFLADELGWSDERASGYVRIYTRWPEVEEMLAANPQRVADLPLTEVLRGLARPRKKAGACKVRVTPGAIEGVGSGRLGRAARCQDAPASSDGGNEPGSVEDRWIEGPAATAACSAAGGTGGLIGGGEVQVPEVVDVEGDGLTPPGQASGNTPAATGNSASPMGRPEDLRFLAGSGPIRAFREELGDRRAFDADAILWRLLRSIAGEVLSRAGLVGGEHGLYAPVIVEFLRASSPGEWDHCRACHGAGRLEPGGEACPPCSGRGYLIPV